ncbi:hypothetical protein J3R30DRAFT_3317514 [Lentinula aciculospora]|uniref:FAD/NAD(P)-binding domain-containing protein n=1 Tax=Lentinula aciculospora TaxID=153920 RepID=A0A9W8ZRS1_9AGAR|nr:hypothetical protein J3R30DRAFT_3317514 [Lentinula aciculospora]
MTFVEGIKTVVVLGGAYAGARAVQILSKGLPLEGWRIVLVDRNTHINHVYVFPRLAVLPGHEHKGFIPFSKLLLPTRTQDLFIHATVRSVHPSYVVLDRAFPDRGIPTPKIHFDYLVYALGSTLPAPLDLWGSNPDGGVALPLRRKTNAVTGVMKPYAGTKQDGILWLKAHQEVIKASESLLVVGGGALGIQFATDIAVIHPEKTITLLHSRHRLLPRFDEKMHTEILDTLMALNIEVVLGERLDMQSISDNSLSATKLNNGQGQRVAKTLQGRELTADLILLCTGQKPNTYFLSEMDKRCINPHDNLAHVLRTMQLGILSVPCDAEESETEITPYPNIFVIGDAADAFGAIPAGHAAYYQGEVAARNILRLISCSSKCLGLEECLNRERHGRDGEDFLKKECEEWEPLEHYAPGLPAIKVSLGLTKSISQALNGVVRTSDDGVPDLNAAVIWRFFGCDVKKEDDMYA